MHTLIFSNKPVKEINQTAKWNTATVMQAVLFLHGETDLGKKLYSQQRLSNLK
jgi:hypothetical protein